MNLPNNIGMILQAGIFCLTITNRNVSDNEAVVRTHAQFSEPVNS